MTNTAASLWDLPEVIQFHVISFVAGPTQRTAVVCKQLMPLCKGAYATLSLPTNAIWDAILSSDYGVTDDAHSKKRKRCSDRLKQSHLQHIRDAHFNIRYNTEIAYVYLSEMCMASHKKACLSKAKLLSLIDTYGPHIRFNQLVSSGGTFLVEICRARSPYISETAILKCTEELVERHNVNVNLMTHEPGTLTALCVAAARGMSNVVKYLLSRGADPRIPCSGRFRLYTPSRGTQSRRIVKCTQATAMEFAKKMKEEEKAEGASESDLRSLTRSIKYLAAAAALLATSPT